uniref:Uncharacterized protein n=1 Tax=viral metagenome TaxID=1070528 RepID=A0A6C0JIJ6_9ZZZZ
MELILEKLKKLEERIAVLEKNEKTASSNNFKESIKSIQLTNNDIELAISSSMSIHIIKILCDENNKKHFLKLKRVLYKFEEGEWSVATDDDITYMFEYVEYLIHSLYKEYSVTLNEEDFLDTNKIIYGLNLKKNLKKIKALFLQSL